MEETGEPSLLTPLPHQKERWGKSNPRMMVKTGHPQKWQQNIRGKGQPVQNEVSQKAPEEMSSER